jgi:hypothetical protein
MKLLFDQKVAYNLRIIVVVFTRATMQLDQTPGMKAKKWGRIVTIGSGHGR